MVLDPTYKYLFPVTKLGLYAASYWMDRVSFRNGRLSAENNEVVIGFLDEQS